MPQILRGPHHAIVTGASLRPAAVLAYLDAHTDRKSSSQVRTCAQISSALAATVTVSS